MSLLESCYSLAFFWSAYDCSIAVATTNHISLSLASATTATIQQQQKALT
jgi:hypothetical protein